MKDPLVAGRYARALFEIANGMKKDEEVEAELESFSQALRSSPEIEPFLMNPYFDTDQKRAFLKKIYPSSTGVHAVLLDFFHLLFKKNRFELIHEISTVFKRIADEAQGQGVAEIRTAVPLDRAKEKEIVAQLERIAGYTIEVKREVDPALIGGVTVRIKNKVWDGSVLHKLQTLKRELTAPGAA